ncbi:hypothetical protein Droror1_Dr00013226 [Drosera rotundifolia]
MMGFGAAANKVSVVFDGVWLGVPCSTLCASAIDFRIDPDTAEMLFFFLYLFVYRFSQRDRSSLAAESNLPGCGLDRFGLQASIGTGLRLGGLHHGCLSVELQDLCNVLKSAYQMHLFNCEIDLKKFMKNCKHKN